MNLTDDLKSTLNKTLEIALGIEKANNMINPQKAHTEGKNLVNVIYKDIQTLSNQSRGRNRLSVNRRVKTSTRTATASDDKSRGSSPSDFKKTFSISIKSINHRLKMSRAGHRTVGQVLNEEFLPFNKSFDRTFSSRSNTPKPKTLPFVSLTTGKLEKPVILPHFTEYLENKGSNYLKMKFNDELLGRFDKASTKVMKFNEDFDTKVVNYVKAFDERTRRGTLLKKPSNPTLGDIGSPSLRRRTVAIKNLARNFQIEKPKKKIVEENQMLTIQGFNTAKKAENQKFLDIINKIDLERPMILRQKVNLIQNDHEKYKNNLHSLKKFAKFRLSVESTRRKQQSINYRQGSTYMNIIEGFRTQRYKPSLGELEILGFWKQMIECGWVVTKADLEEITSIVRTKNLYDDCTRSLLQKFSQAVTS